MIEPRTGRLAPEPTLSGSGNYGAHFAVGAGWGATHSLVARGGLRGQSAVAAAFGLMWTSDVLMMAALGPRRSSVALVGKGPRRRRGGQARTGRGHGARLRPPDAFVASWAAVPYKATNTAARAGAPAVMRGKTAAVADFLQFAYAAAEKVE